MGLCSDPALTHLKSIDYNVIRLPREGIEPLTVLGWSKNSVQVLGKLSDLVVEPGTALPPVSTGLATNVNGRRSSSLKIGIGLDILGGMISALGGGKLGASVNWTNAKTVTFLFENVESASVPAIPVGRYLQNGDLDERSPAIAPYLTGGGRLLVLVDVLKSDKISVQFNSDAGIGATLDVPVIEGAVGGNLKVDASRKAQGILTFAGQRKLSFAFKCFQVVLKDGELRLVSVDTGSVYASVDAEKAKGVILIDGGAGYSGFVDIDAD